MTSYRTTHDLIRALKRTLIRQRIVLFAAGLLSVLAVVMSFSLILSLAANIAVLPVWLKISLLSVAGLVTALILVRWGMSRLFEGSIIGVAVAVEERFPELKGRLVAAVQFAQGQPHRGFSEELIGLTHRQALERAAAIDTGAIISFAPVIKKLRGFAVVAVIAALLPVLFPGFFSYSYEVYSQAGTEVAPPLAYELVPVPATSEWVKYRDIKIGAALFGARLPDEAYVHYRLAGGSWQTSRIDIGTLDRTNVAVGDSVEFGITLRQINRSFDFWVDAGRRKTEVQSINVVDRPRVSGLKVDIFYPDYTGLKPLTIDENNGSFSAVVGSRANLTIRSNLPVKSGYLLFDDSSRVDLNMEGMTGTAALKVEQSRSYVVRLVDNLGEMNPDPIEYYVTAVPDEYPTVDVIKPGFDVNLSDDMYLPFSVRIFDDYGFSSLVLKYTVVSRGRSSEENVAVLHYSDQIKTEGEVSFNWDVDPLNLYPGDYVTYYFEVADNDRISGPKIGRSRQYMARVPSLEEQITDNETENRERIMGTEDLIKSGKELVDRVQKAARKLDAETQRSKTTEWQDQKELKAVADQNAEMVDKIEKMAAEMDKALDKMQENSLMSRQVLEKLAEIQKLFEEVATQQMKDAQKRLAEALKKMDRNQLQEALKNFEVSQEELLQRLERTLALLKKMQVEQKMEAMLRQAEQLAKRQEEVNNRVDSSSENSLPKMGSDEDKLAESMKNLKQETEKLEEMMRDADMSQSEEARKFSEAVKKSDADQNMQSMSQAMGEKKKSESSRQGSEAHSKLMSMIGEMQKQLLALQGDDSSEIQRAMRRMIEDANYLSHSEEDLMREAASLDVGSTMLREMAGRQQDLAAACNGLKQSVKELGAKSPFVAGELQSLLNNSLQEMESASRSFENLSNAEGRESQRSAMSDLNKAAIRLMESLEEQSQCDKGKNCSRPMAKLESLCNKQNKLNQQTQGECNNPGMKPGTQGKLSEREAMQRLAGEQGAIRRSVEELAREFGNSRQVLGRLDNIAGDMKEIEEALSQGEVGQDVTERQLKVLSRMLEASRSLQRRDYTEQRRSTTATTDAVLVPKAIPSNLLDGSVGLEDRLRQFMGEGYPEQYQEQIKAYFRALLRAGGEQVSPETK